MQKNIDTTLIDFRTIFPDVFEKDPFEIVSVIEGELSKLVYEEILSESPTVVYVVERKGVNLFHPFFNAIVERHHIGDIRLYKNSKILRIKGYVSTNAKEPILITDAIGSGDEVSTICAALSDLSDSNISVSKVCGYVAKKRGIDELRKKFPQITFKFIHEAEDDGTYNKVLWMLTPVYHSRLEPLDSEHPFYLYLFTHKIGEDTMNHIIVRACDELFRGDFSIKGDDLRMDKDDKLRSDNIVGWTVECDDPNSMMGAIIPREQEKFFQAERLELRFRFDASKSRLLLMAFCSPVVDIIRFRNSEVDCRNFLSRRYCDIFEKDIQAHEVICPLCIDANISLYILDKFENELQSITEEIGHRVITVRKYDPFKNI